MGEEMNEDLTGMANGETTQKEQPKERVKRQYIRHKISEYKSDPSISEPKSAKELSEEISDEESAELIKNAGNVIFHFMKLGQITDEDIEGIHKPAGNLMRTLFKYLGIDSKIYVDAVMVGATLFEIYKEKNAEKAANKDNLAYEKAKDVTPES